MNVKIDRFLEELKFTLSSIISIEYNKDNHPKYTLDDHLPHFGNFYVSRVDRVQSIYRATKRCRTLKNALACVNTFRLQILDDDPKPTTWYLDGQLIGQELSELIERNLKKYPMDGEIQKWWSYPQIHRTERKEQYNNHPTVRYPQI